jgi:hypothetical protein
MRPDSRTVIPAVVVAAALAAIELSTRSLWLDEGATVSIASQHGAALWHAIAHDGGNMLAYYLLMHVVIGVFGSGEVAIRVVSVIATGATAGIVAALGVRLFDSRRVAWSAAGLVAVSVPLVYWGQDARGYALMVSFATASFLALACVLGALPGAPAPRRGLAVYGLTLLVALYLGFDAVLIVPAQLLVVWRVQPERLRAIVATLAVVAVASVPLAVLAVDRGSGQLFWVPPLSLTVLGQAATTLTSAGMPPNFHHTATTVVTEILTAVAVIVCLVRGRGDGRLLVVWIVVTVVLSLLVAVAGTPLELSRLTILVIPAVALLLAARLPLGAVAVLGVLWLLQLIPAYGTSPENWRAAVPVASRVPACVAFYPEDGRMPFDYYLRSSPAAAARLTPVLPALPWRVVRPYVERYVVPSVAQVAALAGRCPSLVLVASHEGQRHGTARSESNFRGYRRVLALLSAAYPHQRQRDFGYAAVVRVIRFTR